MRMSGRLRSALVIGGQGIRARKLRTLLSMISLFLGVLAVVTVQAGAAIADRAVRAEMELSQGVDGTIRVYLPYDDKTVPIALDTVSGAPDIVATVETTAVLGEPGLTPVNPGPSPFDMPGMYAMPPEYSYCDQTGCRTVKSEEDPMPTGQAVALNLVGLTGDVRQFRPFRLVSGRWLDFAGDPLLAPGLVVNKELAKGLERHQVPAELAISGGTLNATPRVVGVVDDGNSQPTAYTRADELALWMEPRGNSNLYMWPSGADTAQVLQSRLAAAGLDMGQWSQHVLSAEESIGGQLDLMRWIFLGMAVLVLLIGVAGILNVGLATVGERVEEFALRRAVGTPRVLLAGIVLAETMIIGLLTAGAAIGVGVLGIEAVTRLFGDERPMLANLAFPWEGGVAGVVAGLAAGVLGGLLPAIRAARIPIATVMRA